MDAVLLIARLALTAVFAVAGIGKLLDLPGSESAVKNFGVPTRFSRLAAIALPVAELVIAFLLLPVTTARYGAILAFLLMLVFIAAISNQLRLGNQPDCHCFGQIHSEPAGPKTLIRNGVFAIIAAFIATFGWQDAGYSLTGWMHGRSGFEWTLLFLNIVALAGFATLGWLMTHVLTQNGRLLLKLDELEDQLTAVSRGEQVAGKAAQSAKGSDTRPGLPIGSIAPEFSLTSVEGETKSLTSLRGPGKPVVLIFADPGCGPCSALMPEIGQWQDAHADILTIALMSRGTLEKNLEKVNAHNLQNVLLQPDRKISDLYKAVGTPSAVLVQPNGAIGSKVAGGSEAIREMIDDLREQFTQRHPAPVVPQPAPEPVRSAVAHATRPHMGDPAPGFSLSNLDGVSVSLSDLAGKDTVLIFWRPGCGFCQRMADDIRQWEANRKANDPRAVFISSEGIDANRALGFTSTILLNEGNSVMRSFGASGTPTGILIDKAGKVASQLRVGAPGVLSLLRNEESPAQPAQPVTRIASQGQPAPEVTLPAVSGEQFTLSSRKGRKTLLLFWSPTCGFCKRMLGDLKAWEAEKSDSSPDIVIISNGSSEANVEQGFRSTVLLDQAFSTGRSFGATGTPSAVLIDERGSVASPVAVGAPRVLALAGAPQTIS